MSFGPPIPGFLDRVNFITAFFWQGCDAPLTLFCQFAGPPAGRAVAMIIGLDAGDIVKEFFRPAGLRSHRHGRKGARGKKGIPELPDPNDAVAKRIPGQQVIAGRRWGSPTFYAFEISDNLDRVAFNVAILDVVTDTTYQALLGILSVDNTNCPWVARGASHGEYSTILNTGSGWGNKVLAYVDFEHRLDMRAAGVDLPAGGSYLVTFEMEFWQRRWPETRVQIGLRDQLTGEILAESGLVTLYEGDRQTLNIAASAKGGRQIQWLVRSQLNQTDTPMQKASAVQVSQ